MKVRGLWLKATCVSVGATIGIFLYELLKKVPNWSAAAEQSWYCTLGIAIFSIALYITREK